MYSRIFMLAAVLTVFVSCTLPPSLRPNGDFTLMTWNVENLFDDVHDGNEYPEFDPEKGWTREAFWRRCSHISQVIRSAVLGGPDFVALQEIENEHTLRVLNERFLSDLGYQWIQLAPGTEESVRVAFLSRFPPQTVSAIWPPSFDGDKPLRPIFEVEWKIGSRSLILMNNHWKSRIPDAEATERLRCLTAEALNRRLDNLRFRSERPLIFLLGDFNASPELSDEFSFPSMVEGGGVKETLGSAQSTRLVLWKHRELAIKALKDGKTSPIALYDFWGEWHADSSEPYGSYVFDKKWSRLDHILLPVRDLVSGTATCGNFHPVVTAEQINARREPRAWSPKDKDGVSDHLPLVLTISPN